MNLNVPYIAVNAPATRAFPQKQRARVWRVVCLTESEERLRATPLERLSFIPSESNVSFQINAIIQDDIPLLIRRHETDWMITFKEPRVLVQAPALFGDFRHASFMRLHTE